MAAGACGAPPSAETAVAAPAALLQSYWDLVLPGSSIFNTTTAVRSCSDGPPTPGLQQGGRRHAAAPVAGEPGAHGRSLLGAGRTPVIVAAPPACLAVAAAAAATGQSAGDTGNRRGAAEVKPEPAAGNPAPIAAAIATRLQALLTPSRRWGRTLADASPPCRPPRGTYMPTAAAGAPFVSAARAASAATKTVPRSQKTAEAVAGLSRPAVWQGPAAAATPEEHCLRHRQKHQSQHQSWSIAALPPTKRWLSLALRTLGNDSGGIRECVRGSGYRGDSSHSSGCLLLLLASVLLLLAQQFRLQSLQSSPAAASCNSNCIPLGIVGTALLPAAALPLSRRSFLGCSSSASSLAAPPLYVGSRALPSPAAAAAPFVHSSGLSERPSRPSSHSSGVEKSGSSSSNAEDKRGSSTSLAFLSSVGSPRVPGAGAAAQRRQNRRQQQQTSSSVPLSNSSRLGGKHERQGKWEVSSLQTPLPLPILGAASTSTAAFGCSSDSSRGAAKTAAQTAGGRNARNHGIFDSSQAVRAATPWRISTTAVAAAGASQEKKSGSKLVGNVKEVTMPALSSTMKEGRIVSWMKQVGERVQVGDVLMVVESDKADMDVEAFDAGFMAYHAVPEGISAPVGSTVALIAEQLEDLPLIEQHGVALLSGEAAVASGEGAAAGGEAAAAAGDAFDAGRGGGGEAEPAAEIAKDAGENAGISELILPALGPSARDGHIAVWKKKEGETVRQGEVLFIVESDKADMDVEAPHDGVLARILVAPGVKVPVGTSVALFARDATAAAAAAASPQQRRVSGAGHMPEGTREVFLQVDSPAAMVSARVVKWLRRVGDFVKTGDKLVVVEDGDGQSLEVRSADDGYLAATRVQEQQQAAAGETLALLVASLGDVAVVQRLLQQQVPDGGAGGRRAEGEAVEYSSFPHKKEAAAGLATWTFPSVDQDVDAQLPPGLTRDDIEQEFLRRVQQRLPPEVAAKMRGPQGAEYVKRLSLRVPPPHTLRDTAAPPPPAGTTTAGVERQPGEEPRQAAGRQGEYASGNAQVQTEKRRDEQQSASSSPYDPLGNPLATTHAASLAAKHKLNLENVRGTGTHARVTLADVQRHLGLPAEETGLIIRGSNSSSTISDSSGSSAVNDSSSSSSHAAAFNGRPLPAGLEKMDSMQKAVARNMEATLGVPVFKVSRGIYVDKLEALLQELKQIIAEGNKQAAANGEPLQAPITMTVLLAKAVALTISKHPLLNAGYEEKNGGQIRHPGSADLAIAVSLEGGGLVTPVLRGAEKKSIFSLAKEWNMLTEKAKQRRLTPADLTGGTFYISNLGMFGVQQFDAVLPRGAGTIMAVGATQTLHQQQHGAAAAAAAVGAGAAAGEKSRRMTVTLTCDHRHIYGTHAALFLKDLAALLETRPSELLVQ